MTVHAVIAVRGGRNAKSRLGARLSPDQRAALVEAMLADMLNALARSSEITRIHIATPTQALARLAASAGAEVILDRTEGLNDAFENARRVIAASEPEALIILLPGDLPLIEPSEFDRAIAAARDGRVALAPAAADGGTGAVILRANIALPFGFGPDSLKKHQAAAAALHLETLIIDAPSVTLDVDRPSDLDTIVATRSGRSAALLREWMTAA